MAYQYDRTNKVLIEYGTDIQTRVRSEQDEDWVSVPNGEYRYESYARALYFGEGCWERLETISDDEAKNILNAWEKSQRTNKN